MRVLLFASAFALSLPAVAQSPRNVDALVEVVRARHDVVALGGAMLRGRELVAIGTAGVRCKGKPERVTHDDLWHLGSCTKAMTATLVARLIERGELAWDRTLGEAFPALRERMQPSWRGVTLAELISNSSGAPHDLNAGGLWGVLQRREGTPREQRMTLLEGVVARPPAAKPGTKFIYSNAGFAMAGAMAEAKTDEAWETLLRREVFEPLGMEHAGFGAPGTAGKIDQPRGHMGRGRQLVPMKPGPRADNPPAIGPAGTVHASLADWGRFVGDQLRGAQGKGKLLEAATYRRLQTPVLDDYACGWVVTKRAWAGGKVLTHAGSNTMWYAVVWMAPAKDAAFLATCNQGGDVAAKACDDVVATLLRQTLEEPHGK